MKTPESNLVVIYSGDETEFRKKKVGIDLIEQLLISVGSLRRHWSKDIEIIFVHTKKLSTSTTQKLKQFNVTTLTAHGALEPDFLMANKIQAGQEYRGNKDILFLDCDTVIHKKVEIKTDKDLLVAYDCLQAVPEDTYKQFFKYLESPIPDGHFTAKPSFEYYYNDRHDLFPMLNSGVYYLKNGLQKKFYEGYEKNFRKAFDKFKNEKWRFYIEQLAFCATVVKQNISYELFPKGYNYICTPRAPYLEEWPQDQIVIEHYAGDTSQPIGYSSSTSLI